MSDGHAPDSLREAFLQAAQAQDETTLKTLWKENRGYVWGRFTSELPRELQTWVSDLWRSVPMGEN